MNYRNYDEIPDPMLTRSVRKFMYRTPYTKVQMQLNSTRVLFKLLIGLFLFGAAFMFIFSYSLTARGAARLVGNLVYYLSFGAVGLIAVSGYLFYKLKWLQRWEEIWDAEHPEDRGRWS